MSATFFFEKTLPDYRGSKDKFTLSVAERDGLVVVDLSSQEGDRACMLEVDEARQLIKALEDAVARIGYKS